jgi:hypothetical protein
MIEQPSTFLFKKQIEQKIADARKICEQEGFTSENCAIAWETVEQLQTEAAHQQIQELRQKAFDDYCQKHLETKDIGRYDPWFCHWEEELTV